MKNYEYIIASLPDITKDWKFPEGSDETPIISFIKGNCSESDLKLVDSLLDSFNEDMLNEEFYRKALAVKNPFLKKYFIMDLNIRNTKVEFLNRALDRPLEQDIFMKTEGEYEDTEKLHDIFSDSDLLSRERRIDDYIWEKMEEMTVFDYFDLSVILAFIIKLHIVTRWLKLDEGTGRQMFRKLVNEVRGTFQGVPQIN